MSAGVLSCQWWLNVSYTNVSGGDFMSLVSCILALELGLECCLITKQCQSSTVSTTSPLPAFPGNTILQCLLAWRTIVKTNTNHVPFSAFPAIQPLMTFPVTSRSSVGDAQTKWTKRSRTTCQTSSFYGRMEWKRVGEHSDDVKNDLLIIHYLPSLLMRWWLLNN